MSVGKKTKKSVDHSGSNKAVRKRFDAAAPHVQVGQKGVGCDQLEEPLATFLKAPCEDVREGQNNSCIVLGRDRPASKLSGYGGSGDTQCGTIDLVVGRMAHSPRSETERGEEVWVDPNMTIDSARIYISQKTDADDNFNLCDGKVGKAKTKSAVILKADGVRLVAREGIKLVTKTDKKNSQGVKVSSVTGIDLIAGNNDKELQPFVKGINMVKAMKRIVHHIDKLNGIVDSFLMYQYSFNAALKNHRHCSPFNGSLTDASITVKAAGGTCMLNLMEDTKKSLSTHKTNLQNMASTYLVPSGGDGKGGRFYICSAYNHVN